jgi:hypothetical protein
MNNKYKIEYYNILNSIRIDYLKSKMPFNILNQNDIKLTYKDIYLKYIKDKQYFIKASANPPFYKNNKEKKGGSDKILVFC